MSPKTSPTQASKGSVQIKVSNGRLQLVFSYAGKRHYLSTGLADTPTNQKLAARKAAIIEDDIFKERFDPTLEKYRPKSAPPPVDPSVVPTPMEMPKTCLIALWIQRISGKYTTIKSCRLVDSHEALPD
jgi:integrase